MLVFFNFYGDKILIRACAEGPGMIGDLERYVRPGESFADIPYDVLRSVGEGQHTLESLQALAANARKRLDK